MVCQLILNLTDWTRIGASVKGQ